jgi:drug/metabolite transporter (DMT)-like permease
MAAEWASGARPVWTVPAVAGTLYLSVVISALGYVAWNWALARVPAPRAALFLNVQPIAGALLGALLLDEPLTGFTVAGGVAIVAGLAVAFGRAAR